MNIESRHCNEKLILVDCDGVLLDWESGFHRFMTRYEYVTLSPKNEEYKMQLRYSLDKDHSRKLVRHFNESAMMGSLSPLRDAVKYVKKLHEEHGYMFHVVTSQSNLYQANELRKENLTDLFGNVFAGFTFLDCGSDKHKGLIEFKDTGLFWVEDKLENAVVGEEHGLSPILIRHDYTNSFIKDGVKGFDKGRIPILDNWKEIYNYIIGD